MNAKPDSCTTSLRGAKLAHVIIETVKRRRIEHFTVLSALTEMLPRSADKEGKAVGTLRVAELAGRACVSGKAVDRSLRHWREWRVLWLWWKGDRVWDVRFERAVVEALLTAWTASPREVGRLLIEHRRKRESVAPRPVPKTIPTLAPLLSS